MNLLGLVRFGSEEFDGVDTCGVCFYGDAESPAAPYQMMAATAETPEQAALSDHQIISFWFRFKEARPSDIVVELSRQLIAKAEQTGWQIVCGDPETGSSFESIGTDTSLAVAFNVVVEKPETKPEFSAEEIRQALGLSEEMQELVYSRKLEKRRGRGD